MTRKKASKLQCLALAGAMLGSAGCASMPLPLKVVATPIAVARDVIDIPLYTLSVGLGYLGQSREPVRTDTYGGYTWSRGHSGPGLGVEFDVTGLFGKAASGVIGILDYIVCRSFTPDLEGTSPWKESDEEWNYFANWNALWRTPEKKSK